MSISIKWVYEMPESTDGTRILVDRLWPRGITKEKAKIDLWLKEAAPSTELRKWFGHDPEKWSEFKEKYRAELKDDAALAELYKLSSKGKLTLVYAAKDENHNNAAALRYIISHDAKP